MNKNNNKMCVEINQHWDDGLIEIFTSIDKNENFIAIEKGNSDNFVLSLDNFINNKENFKVHCSESESDWVEFKIDKDSEYSIQTFNKLDDSTISIPLNKSKIINLIDEINDISKKD